MKIRTNFVSNSSSSSFCIVGTTFDSRELKKLLDADGILDYDQFIDIVEDRLSSLYVVCDYENETVYVGINMENMRDSETLKDLKNLVIKELEAAGIKTIKYSDLRVISEEVYN
jgi:hypothetical protein